MEEGPHEYEGIRQAHEQTNELGIALLPVCRQIHGEAALLPYALNTIIWKTEWATEYMVDNLQPMQKSAI